MAADAPLRPPTIEAHRHLTAGDLASRPAVAVAPSANLYEAAVIMCEHNIGAVVVLDDRSGLVGILSERDILHAVAKDVDTHAHLVADEMTSDVITVEATWAIHEAASAMTDHQIRHVVVTDATAGLGMLSIRDVLLAGQRIDLGGGHWAVIRDPMGYTVRERRRLQRHLLQLGAGPTQTLDLDPLIAEMIGSWSLREGPTAATVAALPESAHGLLRQAVEQELPSLQRAVHPAPGWRTWAE